GAAVGLVNVNGTLFFPAIVDLSTYFSDGTGFELWKSDGTAAGTMLVNAAQPTAIDAFGNLFANVNGTLLFKALGGGLWMSDGTAAGTVLVKDINPGSGSSYPNTLANLNGKLLFAANDGVHGEELWTASNIVNVLEDALAQTIDLTGIATGGGELQKLT